MKLGAGPQVEPRVSEGDDVVVSGSVAAVLPENQLQPGAAPVQGTLIATANGENVFQPNPTTVTVVPPARRINVVGGPEAVEADEDLGSSSSAGPVRSSAVPLATVQTGPALQQQGQQVPLQLVNQIPSFAPQYGQQGAPAYSLGQNVYAQPQMQPQMYGQVQQQGQPQMYGQVQQQGQQQGYQPYQLQGLNMGSMPAVYAASVQPPPAQVYTTNIPGAPPTISIETDPFAMQQFGAPQPQGPKPRRTLTLKRGSGSSVGAAGSGAGGEAGGVQSGGANVTVNVIKGT